VFPNRRLYRGGNPHLASRFYEVVLGLTMSSKMVSKLVEFKGHLPIHAPSPESAGSEASVLGKTLVPHRIDKTLD
jgi:hypothetical protein